MSLSFIGMVAPTRSANVHFQKGQVTRAERERVHGHRGVALWFTGLPGAGKTTLAHALEHALIERGFSAYVLDGDNMRLGLSRDLGFSAEERHENIRRVGEVARLFADAGVIVLCALVSPYRSDRGQLRSAMPAGDFVEIYVRASIEVCRTRDPKGLYGKAAVGELANMTGVAAPYEAPDAAELVLDTEHETPAQSIAQVIGFLELQGYIPAHGTVNART